MTWPVRVLVKLLPIDWWIFTVSDSGPKRSWGSCVEEKCHVDVRGQRSDRLETTERQQELKELLVTTRICRVAPLKSGQFQPLATFLGARLMHFNKTSSECHTNVRYMY